MTVKEATTKLRQCGIVEFHGYELWETCDSQGEYTGSYRMAPKGQREDWADYPTGSIATVVRYASTHRMMKQ